MADVDEDRIPALDASHNSRNETGCDSSDSEGDSDIAPDYRFLNTALNKCHALPSRGMKDFEPNPTARQASSLDTSRKAMHDALSVIRVHKARKNEMVGVYFSDPADWDGVRFEAEALSRVQDSEKREKMRASSVLKAGEGRCVAVEKFTSTFARTMGQCDRRNWTWLLPEEALFLLERGSLDVRYAADESDEEGEDGDGDGGEDRGPEEAQGVFRTDTGALAPRLKIGQIPMSLQGAYAAFIGKSALTLEEYLVYANLRRGGYIVQRVPTRHGSTEGGGSAALVEPTEDRQTLNNRPTPSGSASLVYRLVHWLFSATQKAAIVPCYNSMVGPLISLGLFRSYGDIFRQLYLIPQHQYTTLSQPAQNATSTSTPTSSGTNSAETSEAPLHPTYFVNKPSSLSTYKKSTPPRPHYTVVVLDSLATTIPTSSQIGALLDSMPDEPPSEGKKRLEARIKQGRKSILVAVVDCGLVSYVRFSGGGFGMGNWLWEENERRGKMSGGGKGGGNGKGGARGRGGGAMRGTGGQA